MPAIGLGAAALMIGAPAARAGLGEPETTVAKDAAVLRAAVTSATVGSYKVHEMHAPSGTLVKEYATPAGTVFAVTWRGPHLPDLAQVLGPTQYAAYLAAARQAPADAHTRHHVKIRSGDLVVEMSGHMRAFVGRAYLQSSVPAGVSAGELE